MSFGIGTLCCYCTIGVSGLPNLPHLHESLLKMLSQICHIEGSQPAIATAFFRRLQLGLWIL